VFGFGFGEILLILVVALLVLGPKKLPEAARSIGRASAQLRRTVDEFHREVDFTRPSEIPAESPSYLPEEAAQDDPKPKTAGGRDESEIRG